MFAARQHSLLKIMHAPSALESSINADVGQEVQRFASET
jgi:hypothetical protein